MAYPINITIIGSNEYGILIELTLSAGYTLYPHVILYPSSTLYPTTEGIMLSRGLVESTEYNITITQSGGS